MLRPTHRRLPPERRWRLARLRASAVLGAGLVGVLLTVPGGPASAQVTAVTGNAFGVSAPNVTLFGGAQPAFGPRPTAVLPSAGSSSPVTGSDPSDMVVFGPATLFESGTVSVRTVGTAAGGSVMSSSTINGISNNNGENFTADSLASTCTANGTNSSSTTVTNGVVATKIVLGVVDTTQTVTITPGQPTTISGTNEISAASGNTPADIESFTWVFNTVATNGDGSITVTAAHEELLGPTAKGDLYLGQSTCGITGTPATTTTTAGATTTTTPGATTTTTPGATTTTSGATTTTTPGATTTTTTPGATTTTTSGATTTTTVPPTTTTTTVAVGGSAYGFYVKVSLFGGSPGIVGPTPTVSLPSAGSSTPVTKSAATGSGAFGPATFFTSGAINVSTQGTPSGGSVTSSATLGATSQPSGSCSGSATSCLYVGSFSSQSGSSTCTASGSGVSGSATLPGAVVITSTDTNQSPLTTMAIPAQPPANDTVSGFLYAAATDKESFKFIFNEQTVNANGTITVNAIHEVLLGPTATGDVIVGQSVCARLASNASNSAAAAAQRAASAANNPLASTGGNLRFPLAVALVLISVGWIAARWAEEFSFTRGSFKRRSNKR